LNQNNGFSFEVQNVKNKQPSLTQPKLKQMNPGELGCIYAC